MRFVVCVKQVPDTAAHIDVREGSLEPHLPSVPPAMNPFDEFALEETLRLRTQYGGDVMLLSLARESVEETIFHGLAMGADSALVLDAAKIPAIHPRLTGLLLADALRGLAPDLICCGDHAVDDDAYEVSSVIAEKLGLPQICTVERIDVDPSGVNITARCPRPLAVEIHTCSLPAVVTFIRGVEMPRYPTMDGIFEAGAKPWETRVVSARDVAARTQRVALSVPNEERTAEIITITDGDADAAVRSLLNRVAARTPVLQ